MRKYMKRTLFATFVLIIVAAALDSRIRAIAPAVPFMGDFPDYGKIVWWPVYMSFGLQDPVCPPHTNFAIYNNFGSEEKHFLCVPTCGHAMWKEEAWPPVRQEFFGRVIAM